MKPAKPAPDSAPAAAAPAATRQRTPRKSAPAQPPAPVTNTAPLHDPSAHAKKIKLIRDGFAMPSDEYAQLALLKQRALAAGVTVKKSELLRSGLRVLSLMTERNFLAALAKLPQPAPKKPKKKG